ncbi:hypothetical protein Prum_065550 [Phytohabitans rumicis]|uniref:Uncharacterized protein n=1 Tax=Phytohabitans rumicis TaxID=1076125 RepID=A0A6V8L6N6_9ACTN|nr:hypothetical protein Prum_065550 [Phytohabitans rumicis]
MSTEKVPVDGGAAEAGVARPTVSSDAATTTREIEDIASIYHDRREVTIQYTNVPHIFTTVRPP